MEVGRPLTRSLPQIVRSKKIYWKERDAQEVCRYLSQTRIEADTRPCSFTASIKVRSHLPVSRVVAPLTVFAQADSTFHDSFVPQFELETSRALTNPRHTGPTRVLGPVPRARTLRPIRHRHLARPHRPDPRLQDSMESSRHFACAVWAQ